jgi:hypothetical protein
MLKNLETEIQEAFYAYEYCRRMVASLERWHGRIPSGDKPIAPSTEARRRGLAAIGLGEQAITYWREKKEYWGQRMGDLAKEHPLWEEFFATKKGVGPIMAGMLIGAMGNIEVLDKPSQVWKSAGLHVGPDGRAPRRERGQKGLPGFPPMRMVLGMLRRQLFLARGWYYQLYVRERGWYAENRPDWPAGRQHGAAIRVMERFFLEHLWRAWRGVRGLPAPEPYILRFEEGHTYIPAPVEVRKRERAAAGGRG